MRPKGVTVFGTAAAIAPGRRRPAASPRACSLSARIKIPLMTEKRAIPPKMATMDIPVLVGPVRSPRRAGGGNRTEVAVLGGLGARAERWPCRGRRVRWCCGLLWGTHRRHRRAVVSHRGPIRWDAPGCAAAPQHPWGVPTGLARRRRARPPVEPEPLLLHAGENFFVRPVKARAARYPQGRRVSGRTYNRVLRKSSFSCHDIFN